LCIWHPFHHLTCYPPRTAQRTNACTPLGRPCPRLAFLSTPDPGALCRVPCSWAAGEGLGRGRRGRAEPLQATKRPKQLGLGA